MKARRMAVAILLTLAISTLPAAAAPRWWAGGGLGIALGGDVDVVSVEPAVGYWAREDLTVGTRLIFRYREDNRVESGFSTTDYGGAVFARYFVISELFLQGEYEYLSYEYGVGGGDTDRDGVGSWLAGGGYFAALGRNAAAWVSVLYNFSYDDDEISPYDGPWVMRAGIGFRF